MQLPSGQLLGNFNQVREERPVGMVPFERMDRMPMSQEGQMGRLEQESGAKKLTWKQKSKVVESSSGNLA